MPAERAKNPPKLYRLAALANVLIAVVLVIAAVAGSHGLTRHARLGDELEQVQALNQKLQSENAELKAQASALKSDPDYIEWVIRDEFGWVRSDELVFIFPPGAEKAPAEERTK